MLGLSRAGKRAADRVEPQRSRAMATATSARIPGDGAEDRARVGEAARSGVGDADARRAPRSSGPRVRLCCRRWPAPVPTSERLSELAPQYGFGFVDHDRRRVKAHPATGAAAYLSSYFVNGARTEGGAVGVGDVGRDAECRSSTSRAGSHAERRGARCGICGSGARSTSCGERELCRSIEVHVVGQVPRRCFEAASSWSPVATWTGAAAQFRPRSARKVEQP